MHKTILKENNFLKFSRCYCPFHCWWGLPYLPFIWAKVESQPLYYIIINFLCSLAAIFFYSILPSHVLWLWHVLFHNHIFKNMELTLSDPEHMYRFCFVFFKYSPLIIHPPHWVEKYFLFPSSNSFILRFASSRRWSCISITSYPL